MRCRIAQGDSRVWQGTWRHIWAVWVIALLVVLALYQVCGAATAYYSATGAFTDGTETQSFLFNLNSALRSGAPFTLRTWHHGGGTNAAGDTIAAGGFDPILRLYNDAPTLIAENDDYNPPTVRDSQIDWATSGMPAQLPADDYQLNLVAYNNTLGGRTGNWAVDLVADAAKFTLTGIAGSNGSGATTINSLTIGSDDVRLPAKVQVGPLTSMSIAGPLVVGDTGGGEVMVTTGALTTDSGAIGYSNSYLGFEPGAIGNVTLSLGGSWSDNQGINTIGWQGEGNLRVQSGSLASFEGPVVLAEYPGSEGNLTVTGHDSILVTNSAIDIGEGGTGYLRIENEGRVSSTGILTIGADTVGVWGQGTVEVDGKDSLWSTGRLIVGYGAYGGPYWGQGTVRITNGGQISTTGNAQIGFSNYGHDSSVSLTGTAPDSTRSTWTVSGDLLLAGDETNPSSAANSKLSVNTGGFVDVTGTTTVWNGGGTLELLGGELETGSLVVKPGATFTHTDGALTVAGGTFDPGTGTGNYVITGADSADRPKVVLTSGAQGALGGVVFIGHDNYGEVAIEGGAVLTAAGDVAVARAESAPASGKLIVTGSGSRLVVTAPASSSLAVGANGPGELIVTGGGQVQVTRGSVSLACCWDVGGAGSGQISIQGENSRLDAGFLDFRASASDSRVVIRDQGQVRATDANLMSTIWPASQHRIDVEVIDANSLLQVDGDVLWVLGDEGGGTANLEIRNDGSAHAAGEVWLDGYRATGVALTNIDGGMTGNAYLTVDSGLYVGGNSMQSTTGMAELTVGHSGFVSASTVKVWQPGAVEIASGAISTGSFELAGGTLRGNGTVTVSSQVMNAGTVAPGLSAGVLTINGNYQQDAAGTLAIEIGGTAPAQFDRLLVSGGATLHGTLQISLIDPLGGSNVYEPQSGDSFKLLTAAGGLDSATIDNYIWPTLPGGLHFGALYDYMDSSVSLMVVGVLGDYNDNGAVDAADYVVWRNTYSGPNVPASSLAADGDGDGDVDANDHAVWRSHFGQLAGSGAVLEPANAAGAIPEPSAILLLALGIGVCVFATRRKRTLRNENVRLVDGR